MYHLPSSIKLYQNKTPPSIRKLIKENQDYRREMDHKYAAVMDKLDKLEKAVEGLSFG